MHVLLIWRDLIDIAARLLLFPPISPLRSVLQKMHSRILGPRPVSVDMVKTCTQIPAVFGGCARACRASAWREVHPLCDSVPQSQFINRYDIAIDAVPVFLSLARARVRTPEVPYHSMDVFTPLLPYVAT
ncbi:hypothetical protein B0H13DRAFT_2660407 [Mycena leptocephala]|nr:hypothetical protein B0H13DRAFT_2660407 [Mycena leptocephala]